MEQLLIQASRLTASEAYHESYLDWKVNTLGFGVVGALAQGVGSGTRMAGLARSFQRYIACCAARCVAAGTSICHKTFTTRFVTRSEVYLKSFHRKIYNV